MALFDRRSLGLLAAHVADAVSPLTARTDYVEIVFGVEFDDAAPWHLPVLIYEIHAATARDGFDC